MGDTTAKPAGDPPAFEPITTQEAADAYAAAHPPADYEQALVRARDLEERLAVSDRALMAARVSAATGVPASAITGATRQKMEASAAIFSPDAGKSLLTVRSVILRLPAVLLFFHRSCSLKCEHR